MALRVASFVPASKLGRPLCPARQAPPAKARLETVPVLARRRPGGASQASRRASPAARPLAVEGGHLVGHVEVLVHWQAEQRLGESDLVGAEGVAVRLLGVGAVRRGPADVAAEHEQRRAVRLGHAAAQARLEGVEIVGHLAEALDVPAVALEAPHDVVGGRRGRSARRS